MWEKKINLTTNVRRQDKITMAARNKGASLINKTTVAITVGIFALLVFFLDINLFFAIDPDNNNLATPANPVQNDEKEVLYNIQ